MWACLGFSMACMAMGGAAAEPAAASNAVHQASAPWLRPSARNPQRMCLPCEPVIVGVEHDSKVDREWRSARSTIGLDRGTLGMQTASGMRVSMKLRHGGPSFYIRTAF